MHQTIYTQRRLAAIQRIVDRSTALVHHLELDPALAEALHPAGIRDRNVTDLVQLEAIANVLDAVAENAGAPAPTVTAVTVNEFIAPRETYTSEDGGPVQAGQAFGERDRPEQFIPAGVGQADLPAPVLETETVSADAPDQTETSGRRSRQTSRTSKKK